MLFQFWLFVFCPFSKIGSGVHGSASDADCPSGHGHASANRAISLAIENEPLAIGIFLLEIGNVPWEIESVPLGKVSGFRSERVLHHHHVLGYVSASENVSRRYEWPRR